MVDVILKAFSCFLPTSRPLDAPACHFAPGCELRIQQSLESTTWAEMEQGVVSSLRANLHLLSGCEY